ncbi:MAG: hypothetical protein R6W96_04195 [Clostridia bacterium]
MKKGLKILIVIAAVLLILGILGAWVYADISRNDKIKKLPARPAESMQDNASLVLYQLENGILPVSYDHLIGACDYIDGRYDCADFRIMPILRILYVHHDKLEPGISARLKDSLLGFRYWMDQPGEDSMCFWSENHQLLFATAEYLVGKLYPGEVFTNTGWTGEEHMEAARERILIWLEQRWLYGFTEWYSNVYYVEDIAPLANLIEFAEDEEIVMKASIIMDLLLYDVASQSYRGTFVSTSGRAYERNRKSGEAGNSMRAVIQHAYGFPVDPGERIGMDLCFIYMSNYEIPEVLKKIARDTGTTVIKASNGLHLEELEEKGLIGLQTRQIMMQWAMEAFTNHQVIANTIDYVDRNNMFSNEFLNDLKMVNITLLRKLNLLPLVSRILNPVTNGVAIQRADTYTYRTPYYLMATAQSHQPGGFGDQQHPFGITLSDQISLFHSHPAKALSDRGALSGSPGYWVGNGRMPHSVQEENINLSIYRIPDKKGFMERSLVHFTHAYFPSELLDETIIEGRYAFGRLGDVYVAFIARNELSYIEGSSDDLIQQGSETYWICEMGTREGDGSFEGFMARILTNPVSYDGNTLTYSSGGRMLSLEYGKEFRVDGDFADTRYMRHDSPYASNDREAGTMEFSFGGESLVLNFNGMTREY